MKQTDFNSSGRYNYLIAGEAIARKDALLLVGLTGKARKVGSTNFAKIGNVDYGTAQTNAATGQLIAQTQLMGTIGGAGYVRKAVLVDTEKNIFAFDVNDTSAQGAKLWKLNGLGEVIGSVTVSGAATASYSHTIRQLNNGNIVVVWQSASGNTLYYAVYTKNLVEVKATTSVTSVYAAHGFSVVALSGGGFSVIYHDNGSNLTTKLVTYDNTGTVTTAATTIWTRTGTTGNQYISAVQLSSGNIAIAESSINTVSSIGLYYGVFTSAAVSVKAFTLIDATSANKFAEIESSGNGYFCVARADGTNMISAVFDDAGTKQGANYTLATTGGGGGAYGTPNKLVYGNSNFWLIHHRSSDSKCVLTKIPVTGTGYLTTDITLSTTQYNCAVIDAFYANEHIVAVASTTSSTLNSLFVINTATGLLVSSSNTAFGTVTAGGTYHRLVDAGDGAFVCMYDLTTTAGIYLCAGKYMRTAVIGAAAAAANSGSTVAINARNGCYEINAIYGTPAVSFDHSTNTLTGNKGSLLSNSITLNGYGV